MRCCADLPSLSKTPSPLSLSRLLPSATYCRRKAQASPVPLSVHPRHDAPRQAPVSGRMALSSPLLSTVQCGRVMNCGGNKRPPSPSFNSRHLLLSRVAPRKSRSYTDSMNDRRTHRIGAVPGDVKSAFSFIMKSRCFSPRLYRGENKIKDPYVNPDDTNV